MLLRRTWLTLVFVVACSGHDQGDAGHDAGTDAGVDASTRDAGHDSGPRDSGADAAPDGGPDDPEWVLLTMLGDDCPLERALHPERVVPAPDWIPCEWQPVGCLRSSAGGGNPAYFDGVRGYFDIRTSDSRGNVIEALGRTDGPPIAAWRTPPIRELLDRHHNCDVRPGMGDGYAAIVAGYFDGQDATRSMDRIYYAPIDEIGAATDPIVELSTDIAPQTIAVSSEIIAMWTGGSVFAVTPDGRRAILNRDLSGIPQNVAVVGSDVYWEDWADLVRIAHATMDTPATIFHGVDPGDTKGFHTDGVEHAWLEGYDRQPDGHYARLELWAAPYTADASALNSRFVHTMDVRSSTAQGGGWYVMLLGSPWRYRIIRTSDGTSREWTPPDGYTVNAPPLYVSDREILALAGWHLVRLDPHSLPVVP